MALKRLAGWLPVILTHRTLAARIENAQTVGALDAFRYAQRIDDAYWRGYTAGCRDELARRIDVGPPVLGQRLRVVRDGAA